MEGARKRLAEKMAGEIALSDDPGGALRKWREEFGVSQSHLSDRLDVSSSVVSDYESGRRESPGTKMVSRVVDALIEADIEDGGETISKYRVLLGAGLEGDAVKDLRDYDEPAEIDELYDAIGAEPIVDKDARIEGHTVVDSQQAITEFSSDEFPRLYGWTTERALIFTNITRGEGPMVAIRVTNLTPSAVVLHGIKKDDVSLIARRIARLEDVALSHTREPIDEVIEGLREV
ncbi:MAG: helix-turn-helix domain-containing protein [Halobacteriales archaeon]